MEVTMNVSKLNKLAKFLDSLPPRKFFMPDWIGERVDKDKVYGLRPAAYETLDPVHCKSTACVAGWTVYMEYPKKEDREKLTRHPERLAREILGLNEGAAEWLFGGGWTKDTYKATPKQAARAIRKMIEDEK